MTKQDRDATIRTFIMGALIEHSGKPLVPDLIGDITKVLQDQIVELVDKEIEQRADDFVPIFSKCST